MKIIKNYLLLFGASLLAGDTRFSFSLTASGAFNAGVGELFRSSSSAASSNESSSREDPLPFLSFLVGLLQRITKLDTRM
jgi:hypothetical protein